MFFPKTTESWKQIRTILFFSYKPPISIHHLFLDAPGRNRTDIPGTTHKTEGEPFTLPGQKVKPFGQDKNTTFM